MVQKDASLETFIPFWLNQLTSKVNARLAEKLAEIGISIPQWRVLSILHSFGSMSIGKVSELAVINQSTLSRVIDQLERTELVSRTPLPENKRVIEVSLTELGEETFAQIYPVASELHFFMEKQLTEIEREAFFSISHKLILALQIQNKV
ncbi:MAG: MarR family transcriptional regulator [Alphaproteobacteria bacterium]